MQNISTVVAPGGLVWGGTWPLPPVRMGFFPVYGGGGVLASTSFASPQYKVVTPTCATPPRF